MNPNAIIVDGPGHYDPRGWSIMPDYRNKLTIGDLIDLVAYLKSLERAEGDSSATPSRSPSQP